MALVAALSGCGFTKVDYYVPTDAQYLHEHRVCTFLEFADAKIPLGDDITAFLSAGPTSDSVRVTAQIPLRKGQAVRFESPTIELERSPGDSQRAQLEDFQVGVYGRHETPGRSESIPATGELKGLGRNEHLATSATQYLMRDLFISSATFAGHAGDRIVLHLPTVIANGHRVVTPPIAFQRVTQTRFRGGCSG